MTVMIRPMQSPFGRSWALLAGIDSDHPHTVHQYYAFKDAMDEAVKLLQEAENEPVPSDDPSLAAAKRRVQKKPPKGSSL